MTHKQINVKPWEPTPAHHRAAELRAKSLSWWEVHERMGCAYKTLQRWQQIPEFMALVAQKAAENRIGFDDRFFRYMNRLLETAEQVANGELAPNDPKALHAEMVLSQTVYRVAIIEAQARAQVTVLQAQAALKAAENGSASRQPPLPPAGPRDVTPRSGDAGPPGAA